MRHTLRSGSRVPTVLRSGIVLAAALSLGMISLAAAFTGVSSSAQADQEAALLHTWVLESPDQFRPDALPDEAETALEIAQLLEMAG